MEQQSVIHNTFVIERSYPVAPEKVFSALADPDKKRRWYAHGQGHDVEEFVMDFRVGGEERTRYRFKEGTPFPGVLLLTDGSIQDIVPDRRMVIASTMTLGERRISSTLVTFELLKSEQGTDLILTHQGAFYEGADGPKMREDGWRGLMDSLAAELAR
jgi:uncharacterized protein YndB with AHSA1/START domain